MDDIWHPVTCSSSSPLYDLEVMTSDPGKLLTRSTLAASQEGRSKIAIINNYTWWLLFFNYYNHKWMEQYGIGKWIHGIIHIFQSNCLPHIHEHWANMYTYCKLTFIELNVYLNQQLISNAQLPMIGAHHTEPKMLSFWWRPGPWFYIKMSSYQYRKSHCGDKTILRPSYLHNGISYTGKTSLYWIGPSCQQPLYWPVLPQYFSFSTRTVNKLWLP